MNWNNEWIFFSAPENLHELVPNDDVADNELLNGEQYDVGLDEAAGGFEEYDVGLNDVAANEIEIADMDDPLQDGTLAKFFSGFHAKEGEYLRTEAVHETSTQAETVKDEEFNLAMLRVSLDNDEQNESNHSDCIITSAYYEYNEVWTNTDANYLYLTTNNPTIDLQKAIIY